MGWRGSWLELLWPASFGKMRGKLAARVLVGSRSVWRQRERLGEGWHWGPQRSAPAKHPDSLDDANGDLGLRVA